MPLEIIHDLPIGFPINNIISQDEKYEMPCHPCTPLQEKDKTRWQEIVDGNASYLYHDT